MWQKTMAEILMSRMTIGAKCAVHHCALTSSGLRLMWMLHAVSPPLTHEPCRLLANSGLEQTVLLCSVSKVKVLSS